MNLGQILINLDDLPKGEDELLLYGRNKFQKLLLTNSSEGVHLSHDKQQVRFQRGRFIHAFSRADNWQVSKEKTSLDQRRIIRMPWILPMIQGLVSGTECWFITETDKKKRLYLGFKLGYVVWLESTNKGKWDFSTAYTAPRPQIRGYIKGANCERIANF